eukprot:scaffold111894_cov90-Phaeocystis_antarctica.AAC.1
MKSPPTTHGSTMRGSTCCLGRALFCAFFASLNIFWKAWKSACPSSSVPPAAVTHLHTSSSHSHESSLPELAGGGEGVDGTNETCRWLGFGVQGGVSVEGPASEWAEAGAADTCVRSSAQRVRTCRLRGP